MNDEEYDDTFGARYGISLDDQARIVQEMHHDLVTASNYSDTIDKYFPQLDGEMRFRIAVYAMLYLIDQTGGNDEYYKGN